MHPAARRRKAALVGVSPEAYFTPDDPKPRLELTRLERAMVNLASSPDFAVVLVEMEKRFVNQRVDISASNAELRLAEAQGRAEVVLNLRTVLKSAEQKIVEHAERTDAWRRSRSGRE